MARTQSITEADLIGRLSIIFREQGYQGASLASLATAAGLRKASLYHRFPGGKAQMAEEVLTAASSWCEIHILAPLRGPGLPRNRLAALTQHLDTYYASGRLACLLNMLSAPRETESPFAGGIAVALEAMTDAFADLAEEAGAAPPEARNRAERVMMLLHGSLVMSRGLGSEAPFKSFLGMLPEDLLPGGKQ